MGVFILEKPLADPSIEPDPSKLRIWTNRSGLSKIQAQFLGIKDDKILLLKLEGIKISVPREKLSFQDLAYVEDIIETEFNCEDNTDSDSIQAEMGRPDAGMALQTTPSARIVSSGFTDNECFFMIQSFLEDGRPSILTRYHEDFYNLHRDSVDGFPFEALPHLPVRLRYPTKADIARQMSALNDYLKNLLGQGPPISNCVAVKRFLTPREGDDVIDPVVWSELNKDGLYYQRPSI